MQDQPEIDRTGAVGATTKQVRVTHVITNLTIGGAEMMLYKLLVGLGEARRGHAVIVLGSGGPLMDRIMQLGVPVYPLGMGIRRPDWIVRFRQSLRALNPDIIHAWMYHANIVSALAPAILGRKVPVVWGIRAALDPSHSHPLFTMYVVRAGAWLSSRPARIVYNSVTSARQHQLAGYVARHGVVIPNGFDCEVLAPSAQARISIRRELGLDANTPLIGLIARFDPNKDFGTFIKAIAPMLVAQPDAHVLMVGRGVDRNNQALTQLLMNNVDARRVHLLGERTDVPAVCAALDVGCSSSITEAFSNSIGEAMACGVPCVVTDVGDSAYLVGSTGIVVPAGDAPAMTRALLQLLRLSSVERSALGASARQRIRQCFSLDSVVKSFTHLYHDVLLS